MKKPSLKPLDRQLMSALLRQDYDLASALVNQGANVNASDGKKRLLNKFIMVGIPGAVEFLLAHRVDINAYEEGDLPPMIEAAIKGNVDLVAMFFERGADIEALDGSGRTALMAAAENMHQEVIDYLLNKGAKVTRCDEDGRSSADRADEKGELQGATLRNSAMQVSATEALNKMPQEDNDELIAIGSLSRRKAVSL